MGVVAYQYPPCKISRINPVFIGWVTCIHPLSLKTRDLYGIYSGDPEHIVLTGHKKGAAFIKTAPQGIIRLYYLQVASQRLFAFNRFKQGFKVTLAKRLGAFTLNDLKKHRWTVLDRLGEDLQQVAFVITVYEDAQIF
jgi:hypothetical protein